MTDQELLELMPETMRDEFSYAAKVCSDATGGKVKPGIFRVALNTAGLEYAHAVLCAVGRRSAEWSGAMTDHKATPEQWTYTEEWAAEKFACYSCILELRARVEALEADQWLRQHAKPEQTNSNPTPNPSQIRSSAPASSLLERVVMAIGRDGETARWNEARAAIREVAAWLREQHDGDLVAATVLEREAGR
jgi:hypothetical protein